ncbi:MAG: cell wall hydrolase [Clostridia bacterium]|nr:cell wall hydrolase [Clostridia bacterium]
MKKVRTIFAFLAAAALLITPLSAYEPIEVRVNGSDTDLDARLIGTTTYVRFDEVNELLSFGEASVSGEGGWMKASTQALSIDARSGDCYITANERYIGGSETITVDGLLYIPVRSIAKAYNADVTWQDDTRSVDIDAAPGEAIESGSSYYNTEDVYWLSRIIHAEANGEPMAGKVMVGNVVQNRVNSSDFPNTIYNVIFDRQHGVQFTPTVNGMIYRTPDESSVIAAKLCLDGYSLSDSALYFLNPAIATSFWIVNNRPYLTTIGGHDFYS